MSLTDQQIDELARKAEGEMKFSYDASFFNEAVSQLNSPKKAATVPSWVVPTMVATLLFAGSTYMIYQINVNNEPSVGNYTVKDLPIESLTKPDLLDEADVTEAIISPIIEKANNSTTQPLEQTTQTEVKVADQTTEPADKPTEELVQPLETTGETQEITKPAVEENKADNKAQMMQEKGKGGKKSLIPVLGEGEDTLKKPSAFDTDNSKKKDKKVIPPDWD